MHTVISLEEDGSRKEECHEKEEIESEEENEETNGNSEENEITITIDMDTDDKIALVPWLTDVWSLVWPVQNDSTTTHPRLSSVSLGDELLDSTVAILSQVIIFSRLSECLVGIQRGH